MKNTNKLFFLGLFLLGITATRAQDVFKTLRFVGNIGTVTESGIYREEQPNSGYNYTTTLNMSSYDGRQQMTIERGGGGMKFRGSTTGGTNSDFSSWKTVIHDGNFQNYSLPLYGGTLTGALYLGNNNILHISADGTTSDPYGKVSVTRGTASNFAYYGLTRAGSIGLSLGITTTNDFIIGSGTSGGGVISGSYLVLGTGTGYGLPSGTLGINGLRLGGSNSGTVIPALGAGGTAKFVFSNGGGTDGIGSYGLVSDVLTNGNVFTQVQRIDGNATAYNYLLQPNGGNVGIGTTDPKNKLSVNGTIWAKEVKVSLTDAADWVFEKSYKLKPLAEVEKYINENKHLPEVPSAEEFRQNDMNVSEMSNKLLQKIEELTLYAIDQDKKAALQQQELDRLKTENENYKSLAERLSAIEKELKK